MAYAEVHKVAIEHQYPVTLSQDLRHPGKAFRVTYGLQMKSDLSYAEAAKEFGECVMHALACNSQLNNDGK